MARLYADEDFDQPVVRNCGGSARRPDRRRRQVERIRDVAELEVLSEPRRSAGPC